MGHSLRNSHWVLLSDGVCLLQDDLRKDSRLMELFTVINKCLRKDPESRRRGLHIRTYVRPHPLQWSKHS